MVKRTISWLAVAVLVWPLAAGAQGTPAPSGSTASMSSGPAEPSDDGESNGTERHAKEWLKTCLAIWARDTHMTRAEWRATCERLERERWKTMLEEKEKAEREIR